MQFAPADAADGVVGPGNCNEAGFVGVLNTVIGSGGGAISFNCGAAPTTITFTTHRQISAPVTINGGSLISFDGNNASAFFQVFNGASLVLNDLTLKRGVFSSVRALENFGTMTLNRCVVTENVSSASAIANFGELIIRGSTLSANSINSGAARFGAALSNDATARIETSTFSNNTVTGNFGGGGAIFNADGGITIVDSTFSTNSAPDGGAINIASGSFATISGSTFNANSGGYGAAIETLGTLVRVSDARFLGNDSTIGDGGAIWVLEGRLEVDRSLFLGNTSATTGGAISCTGVQLFVDNSAFADNVSGTTGGAIHSSCAMSVTNATFTTNSTTGFNGGGAINQDGPVSALIYYATIRANTAAFGAGLYKDGAATGTLFIGRSIVSANTGGNCDGVVGSNGYNVVNDSGCGGFVETGDLQNANLPLLAFGDYGGPTPTLPPIAGNAAINRIPIADCFSTSDQRGAQRPAGSGCDSGAFEFGATFPTPAIFANGFE
ncbi:MAG: choice-of-anchor Q domain-containing protein [Pseudomonadota bacterium]|nr:choice-of-anchor Q domain-containing protein [Pseudomonadota bacterium]